MRHLRSPRVIAVCLAFLLCTIPAAPDAAAQDKPHYGGHLRVGFALEPTSLDPIAGCQIALNSGHPQTR